MIGGACWIENVIAFALRTHHCLGIKKSFQNSLNQFKGT
jgi:hypothetical protein